MRLTNDYNQAELIERGLFVVLMQDEGWTIADGPGTRILALDELESAGYHLPVRFERYEDAAAAIRSGPPEWFSTQPDSPWVRHCLSVGARYHPDYEAPSGPSNLSSKSG
ncbi:MULTISPECIES: hypothetical protein [Pseudomonas]|uniref:hypothetical protein n=1 Tax=Pseudomonas TaxID=286 RepID=UPI00123C609A|nr:MULTISPECIES: hypothetical protein [Pseudomonas]QIB51978.1 hypothetical protein G3M63_13525 [Pseudomonas sp. OIL-1]